MRHRNRITKILVSVFCSLILVIQTVAAEVPVTVLDADTGVVGLDSVPIVPSDAEKARALESLLFGHPPDFSGARDFLTGLRSRDPEVELSRIIQNGSEQLRLKLSEGTRFQKYYLDQLNHDFSEHLTNWAINPEEAAIRLLRSWRLQQRVVTTEAVLPDIEARNRALRETLVASSLSLNMSITELERLAGQGGRFYIALRDYNRRYFLYKIRELPTLQREVPKPDEIRRAILERIKLARILNFLGFVRRAADARGRYLKWAGEDGKSGTLALADLANASLRFVEIPAAQATHMIWRSNTFPERVARFLRRYPLGTSRRDLPSARSFYYPASPIATTPIWCVQVELEGRTLLIPEDQFSALLISSRPRGSDDLQAGNREQKRYVLEAAARDQGLANLGVAVRELQDPTVDFLEARLVDRQKQMSVLDLSSANSLTAQLRVQPVLKDTSTRVGLLWAGLRLSPAYWEHQDVVAGRLRRPILTELSNIPGKAVIENKRLAKAVTQAESKETQQAPMRESSNLFRGTNRAGKLAATLGLVTGLIYLTYQAMSDLYKNGPQMPSLPQVNMPDLPSLPSLPSLPNIFARGEGQGNGAIDQKKLSGRRGPDKGKSDGHDGNDDSEERKGGVAKPAGSFYTYEMDDQFDPLVSGRNKSRNDMESRRRDRRSLAGNSANGGGILTVFRIEFARYGLSNVPQYFNLPNLKNFPRAVLENSDPTHEPAVVTKLELANSGDADLKIRGDLWSPAKNGRIPLLTLPQHDAHSVHLFARNGAELQYGKDYEVYQIPYNNMIYARLKDPSRAGVYRYDINYNRIRYSTPVDPAFRYLNKATLKEINGELNRVGFTELSSALTMTIQQMPTVSVSDVAQSFEISGFYTYEYVSKRDHIHDDSIFSRYREFLKEGALYYQCTGSNLMLQDYLITYYKQGNVSYSASISVEPVVGFSRKMDKPYVLMKEGHLHTMVSRTDVPHSAVELDATPSTLAPDAESDADEILDDARIPPPTPTQRQFAFAHDNLAIPNYAYDQLPHGKREKPRNGPNFGSADEPAPQRQRRRVPVDLLQRRYSAVRNALLELAESETFLQRNIESLALPPIASLRMAQIILQHHELETDPEDAFRQLVAVDLRMSLKNMSIENANLLARTVAARLAAVDGVLAVATRTLLEEHQEKFRHTLSRIEAMVARRETTDLSFILIDPLRYEALQLATVMASYPWITESLYEDICAETLIPQK